MTLALYVAFALVATAAAARWVTPIGRLWRLALALLPLVAAGGALASGRVMAPIDLPWASEPLASARAAVGVEPRSPGVLHDVYAQMIPWRKAVRWALAQGELPLSNPFMLAGDPLASSAVPAVWHPVNLLALAAPLPQSLTFAAAATLLVAALAMFLAARELGVREPAALVAAAGWAYSSYVGFWLEWPQGPAAAITPLLWLAARRAARAPGPASGALLAFAGAWLLLSGHPESALFAVVAAVALFAFELARARPRDLPRTRAALATGLAGGMLALALTAIDWLPFSDALLQTRQHAERRAIYARLERAAPLGVALENARPNLVPFVHGVEAVAHPRETRGLHAPAATAYAGSVLLAAALYGLVRSRAPVRFVLGALVAAGVALAVKLPVWVDVFRHLPLFDIALPEYGYLWAAPALVLLAALGLEEGLAEDRARRRRFALALGGVGLALAALAGVWTPEMLASGLPGGFVAARTAWLLAPLAAAVVVTAFAPRPRVVALAILALVLVQRRAELGHLYPTFPARIFYPLVAPISHLPRGGEPYRVVGLGRLLPPNSATMWELEDVRGYNAMTLARLAQTFPLWASPEVYWFNRVDELRPFLSLLGTRFALAPPGLPPSPGWRRIEGSAGWSLLVNDRAMRRAFVPRELRFGDDDAGRLAELRRTWAFGRRAVLEPAVGTPARQGEPPGPWTEKNGRGRVEHIERQGSGYRIRTVLREPAWVVVSVAAWRGWRARVERQELPTGIADHAFFAFRAPAGAHEVEVFFRPRSFEVGLAISAATLAGLAVAAVVRRRRGGPLSPTSASAAPA